jgi:transcription antitermination factor NusG
MFGNYVFVRCNRDQRCQVLQTNLASQTLEVGDGVELIRDLRQIQQLLQLGIPLQVTAHLRAGTQVRIRHGPLSGIVGDVLTHQGESYLEVAVNFLQQGAIVKLHDDHVESLS